MTAMRNGHRPRIRELHINRMIPNMLTLLAVCAGLTAIRFAFNSQWDLAAVAILAAAVLDGLDGRIARILKGASKFGAELDSLSDFLSFGVAPAVMLYLWALTDAGRFAWITVLLYTICAALRLARFNVADDEPTESGWTRNYFIGVPSPAGAGLVLLPLILAQLFGDEFFRNTAVVCIFLIGVGALMVSSLPTFSFKKIKVAHKLVLPVMLLIGLAIAALISAPWATVATLMLVYLATIPFSVRSYVALKGTKEEEKTEAAPEDGTPPTG